MPDVDRFETKLRGKGWRKVYRLGCSGAPTEAVVDRIMRAAVNVFRSEGTQCVRRTYSRLQECINLLRTTPLFRESIIHNAFDQLSSEIHRLVEEEGYSDLARLTERAALQTFVEMEQSAQIPSNDLIRQEFMRNLVWDLSQRRCLSAVRDGIMQSTGRDAQAQMNWEAKLRGLLLESCGALSKSLLSEEASGSIRAPRRVFKPKPTTVETLYQPLPVVGESV